MLHTTGKGIKMIKFCPKCQAETERNVSGRCKPCVKAYGAAWHAANTDKAKADNAAWRAANLERKKASYNAWYVANTERVKASSAARYAANPEKSNAASATWRAANPARAKATDAAWKAANPERKKASSAAWNAANTERCKENNSAWNAANTGRKKATAAAWQKANPDARRINEHNRRARQRENGGTLSKGLAAMLFKLQCGKCACCSLPLGDNFHLDHVLPIALGGPNVDDNMQLLTARCNMQKKDKHPCDFMQERGFLL